MQPTISDLKDSDRVILQVIDDEGVVRGSVLRRRAGTGAPQFVEAVRRLIAQGLIGVSGSAVDERSAQEAYFSPVPSTRGLLKRAAFKR